MRDWEAHVSRELAGLALESQERTEVISELAVHLDEIFEDLRRQGVPEAAAVQRTLSEVTDWRALKRRIQAERRKETGMTNRVKEIWLPGFATLFLSTVFLALTQFFGPKPWILSWGHPSVAVLYIPWLFFLPLVGAMGAYLSHRAGGSRRAVFLSIVFSTLPFLASILVVLPVSLIFDHFIAHNIAPMALLMASFGWVLIPVVALLAGGLPVQLVLSRRSRSGRIAGA